MDLDRRWVVAAVVAVVVLLVVVVAVGMSSNEGVAASAKSYAAQALDAMPSPGSMGANPVVAAVRGVPGSFKRSF